MESEIDQNDKHIEQDKATPLCLNCLKPVDPLFHYCPYCGRTTGQLTPYIPFVNIPWQTQIWGQMWRQIWSHDVSFAGKLFRLFMIVWWVPVMLVGLIPYLWQKVKKDAPCKEEQNDSNNDINNNEG